MIHFTKHNKWKLSLPGKALALLLVMAVHSQPYTWWMYVLVIFVGGRLDVDNPTNTSSRST